MMKKNVASQHIGAQMITAADGSAFTGSVTVYVTGDAGTQAAGSVGSGACAHEGNGYHTYAPAQDETNYDLIAFTFTGTGAIPVTVQVYTSFPQTVDNATNIAAIKTKTDYLPSATAGAAGGVFIAGSNAATSVNITGDITGNLSGSVGSVTGAVGSVTGDIGGNVTGTVGKSAMTLAAGDVTGNLPVDLKAITAGVDLSDTMKASVNAEADTALTDYDPPTATEMISAFTEIKGATWSSATDTLEDIRDKQTDIEADTNELQTDDVPGLIAALNDFDPDNDVVAHVTLVDTTTTNTDMRGTDSANTATPLDAAGTRTALGMAAADLDTQLDAIAASAGLDEAGVQSAMDTQGYTAARAAKLDYLDASIAGIGGATGSGGTSWTYTVTDADSGLPIADAEVWISTDSAGSNVIAGTLRTDANGEATFMLDAGTYYVWTQKTGYNFSNPDMEVVS